ncbi:MAG: sugar phosphate isomerase/epimerase family protein [Bryobacteraceae bacterium]
MFWGRKPPENDQAVKSLDMHCGHLGFAGHVPLQGAAKQWRMAADELKFGITSIWAAFEGESYADIPTVHRTVGFMPEGTRAVRVERARHVIEAGAEMGVAIFACHLGHIPEDITDPAYEAVAGVARQLCDHAAPHKMTFALETGQETAPAMMEFLDTVDRANLAINFDPANMIMYGTSDPMPALELMASRVISVHCKDGNWPPDNKPGGLGSETPLGEGAVGMEKFIAKLIQVGYRGPLTIEREVALDQDMDDRHKEGLSHLDDIRQAVALLTKLRDR